MLYCQSCHAENNSGSAKCHKCGCPYLLPFALVLSNEEGKQKGIKSGFNGHAALFGWVWAAYHRAWDLALGLFVFAIVLFSITSKITSGINGALLILGTQIGYTVILGAFANKLLLQALKRKGYSERTTPF